MAKNETLAVPGVFPAHPQHMVKLDVSASGSDAAPPHRKRGARQRPSVPQHRPRGARSQPLQTDTTPTAALAAGEARGPSGSAPAPAEATLTLRVSASLLRQLEAKAQEEGVSLVMLATELLAEGLVLRAWEILERQVAMRSGRGMMPSHAAPGTRGPHPGGGGARQQERSRGSSPDATPRG